MKTVLRSFTSGEYENDGETIHSYCRYDSLDETSEDRQLSIEEYIKVNNYAAGVPFSNKSLEMVFIEEYVEILL